MSEGTMASLSTAAAQAASVVPFLSVHAVRIFVRDLDRSLRFYIEQLGFRLVIDTRLQSGERWVAVSPPDGSTVFAIVAPKPNTAEYKLIGRSTQVVLVTSDVAAKFQQWSNNGVKFIGTPRLRRIKYEPAAESSAVQVSAETGSKLLGKKTPIWGTVSVRLCDTV